MCIRDSPVEVTGTTVTVEMPKGYKFDKSVTVKVVASAGAKVSIPAQSGVSAINSANGTTADLSLIHICPPWAW